MTKKFSCAASKRQARLNRKICACVQLAELKTTWRIKITSSCLVFNSASCTHTQIFLFGRACRLLAAQEKFFVTNDEKYQTCLIFGLHVTNDENAVNVARTPGNFVDPTCHEQQVRATSALVCGGLKDFNCFLSVFICIDLAQ